MACAVVEWKVTVLCVCLSLRCVSLRCVGAMSRPLLRVAVPLPY